ncbi:MAG TPA: TonB-dependent receptor [Flavobacterium sp.]|jgi:iron complex outermembrane receptor protein
MATKKLFSILLLLWCCITAAQNDSIIKLDEVVVSDVQLQDFSGTHSVYTLRDSVLQYNQPSLTDLLNYNSAIYFKENGYGMVSSPSFRGTTAQQTAVIWNGININSQLNGQTDFNTITSNAFESVSIRPGGGSVIYGSSAIGGSIHLTDELRFVEGMHHRVRIGYGSFNTSAMNFKLAAGTKKWSIGAAISRNASDNDFQIPETNRKNSNGQYENLTLNTNIGYIIDRRNVLKLYSNVFTGERHFSLLTPTDNKTKYADFNTRIMIEWASAGERLTSKFRAAYLTEGYNYYPNIDLETATGSKATTFVGKYDATYTIGKITLNGIVDYSAISARGSDIDRARRENVSSSLLMKYRMSKSFRSELGIRKEATSDYESPILGALGARYDIGDNHSIRFNASRNFRTPTFNDLYWTQGGNPNLRPELSHQVEIGSDYFFKNGKLSATAYYMKIDDMIQWLPGTGVLWFPGNVLEVNSYGAEAILELRKSLGKNHFTVNSTYAYTVSENAHTGYQLVYVPFHKATASIALNRGPFSANYQVLFNGAVYTLSDNNPSYIIEPYSVSNLSAEYRIGRNSGYKAGVKILNLFEKAYEVVEHRTFPGRNYAIYLTLNF